MDQKLTNRNTSPHKYTECVFLIEEQPYFHNGCNHIEDSFYQMMVKLAVRNIIIAYITAG